MDLLTPELGDKLVDAAAELDRFGVELELLMVQPHRASRTMDPGELIALGHVAEAREAARRSIENLAIVAASLGRDDVAAIAQSAMNQRISYAAAGSARVAGVQRLDAELADYQRQDAEQRGDCA